MTVRFKQYVDNVVKQTEGSKEEKDDLYEELIIHLQLSQENLIKEGYSEQEAEKKAIECFGAEGEIGGQIQQAMFPYRKEMMLSLSIASILFTVSVYLMLLFIEGDAFIPWLIASMVVSTSLLFLSVNHIPRLNRRRWINSILIVHLFTYLWGWSLASSLNHPTAGLLTLLVWLIILLSLALVYRTTIFDYQPSGIPLTKQAKILHTLNITIGIVIIGITLFFLWAFLAFSGPNIEPRTLLFTIPFFSWIILYIVQMKLVKVVKRKAYVLATISLLITIAIVFIIFIMPMFVY